MRTYAHYGFKDFFLALGYKGEIIKRYFLDHYSLGGSLRVDLASGQVEDLEKNTEDWIVHLIDTGQATQTAGGSSAWRGGCETRRFWRLTATVSAM